MIRRALPLVLLVLYGLMLVVAVTTARSSSSSRARNRAIICRVFGVKCKPALRVAYCETGGTFNRFALGDAGERGLFQIHPVHFASLNPRRLFEARYNARVAFRLSRGGRDWTAWTCKP